MTAYLIARIDVTDPDRYEGYKALAQAAVAAHGGTYVVRGGNHETLEGHIEDGRVVLLEFADMETARAFYHSPEYTRARAARAGAATGQFVLVEGA